MGSHSRPLWLGGLIAPLTGPVLFSLGLFIWLGISAGLSGLGDWYGILFVPFILGLPPSYAATWLFGMPYVLWLRRIGRLSAMTVCIGAMLAGGVTYWLMEKISHEDRSTPTMLIGLAAGSVFGLAAALVFCWITGLWRRPLPAATMPPELAQRRQQEQRSR